MNPLISLVNTLLNAAAVLVELFFTVPVVGRGLKWVWSIVLTLVGLVFGIFDSILYSILLLVGIRLEKKLRVGAILLKDEQGQALGDPDAVVAGLKQANKILLEKAHVRIIPAWEVVEGAASMAHTNWVRTNPESSRKNVLEVNCDWAAFRQDLLPTGSEFEFLMASQNFHGNFRRVTGFGAPIMVFVVKKMGEGKLGCSVGPLSDYVTVVAGHEDCISHELGHACNLLHVEDKENLMHDRGCKQDEMTRLQILLLRASRHTSYF